MIFYLKAHRPIYRDRLNIDLKQVKSEIEERMAQLGITPDLLARAIPALTSERSTAAGKSIFPRVKLRAESIYEGRKTKGLVRMQILLTVESARFDVVL